MLNLSEGERAYLMEMRALSVDGDGHDVFVGLTLDESERYHFLSNPYRSRGGNLEEGDEYLALHNKHERARLLTLAAENEARVSRPVKH